MSATQMEGEASASPSPRPGGIVGAMNEVLFGPPVDIPPFVLPPLPPKTRGQRAVEVAGTAIQVVARLAILVMIVIITFALSVRLVAWAL